MAMKEIAPRGFEFSVFHSLNVLPVFSPDAEGDGTPPEVTSLYRIHTLPLSA
ncbi:hypothetical protein [Ralstonia pseudosolanacearum]|nr:hypothetical protein [Ralstonia pseudosolanacearum]